MKKIYTLLAVLVSFAYAPQLMAQDEVIVIEEESSSSGLSFSGSVDAYFRQNLNAKNRVLGYGDEDEYYAAPGTSFANKPGFALGMVNLVTSYEGEKVGFVADLVFGPRGEEAVFNSTGSSSIVNQLYVYWNTSDNFTLTFGNFNTYLGYEVISPVSNFNYSTSYMFSYGPFSQTGIKADLTVSDNVTLMAAIMNPTDFTDFNPFGSYTGGFQIGLFGNTFINFLYGDQDGKMDEDAPFATSGGGYSNGNTFQIDLTGGYDLGDALYLGVNTTYNTTSAGQMYDFVNDEVVDADGDGSGFFGVAGYLQLSTSETFSLGTRLEYFNVFNGGVQPFALDADGDGNVFAATLSANATIGNLTLIPELRLDLTSEDSFLDTSLEPSSSLASFLLAAVFSF